MRVALLAREAPSSACAGFGHKIFRLGRAGGSTFRHRKVIAAAPHRFTGRPHIGFIEKGREGDAERTRALRRHRYWRLRPRRRHPRSDRRRRGVAETSPHRRRRHGDVAKSGEGRHAPRRAQHGIARRWRHRRRRRIFQSGDRATKQLAHPDRHDGATAADDWRTAPSPWFFQRMVVRGDGLLLEGIAGLGGGAWLVGIERRPETAAAPGGLEPCRCDDRHQPPVTPNF